RRGGAELAGCVSCLQFGKVGGHVRATADEDDGRDQPDPEHPLPLARHVAALPPGNLWDLLGQTFLSAVLHEADRNGCPTNPENSPRQSAIAARSYRRLPRRGKG